MEKQRVELLAPAGNYECFQAALNAGADAVYLGGMKFGARAYANNFTEEEIIRAIKTAHIFGKKIYLTVNTLVKEKEFEDLIPFMTPMYEAGLDGVIIQDFGVLKALREHFPGMELHASTQMTITGAYGAKLLKEQGVCRVVPARELSLVEMKAIKEETGLEIEAFVHGAMCYAYSGQCLFSSILGGRSGNRGRCAGPCRLPYTIDQKTVYPLSLKDMYTLSMIPKLLEAGIDSFKIEGRMKSAEYVAGVTSLYRKYIDSYLENPSKPFLVKKQDEDMLRKLYMRTDICHGYYEQHNGKNMVTIKEPGYSGCSEEVLQDIRKRFLLEKKTKPISGRVVIKVGEPAMLTLHTKDAECIQAQASSQELASLAQNRPLSAEDIEKRMAKLGDTLFSLDELEVETDGKSFLSVKAMNELRREVCIKLEEQLSVVNRTALEVQPSKKESHKECPKRKNNIPLYTLVSTYEQFERVMAYAQIQGIYVLADLCLQQASKQEEILQQLQNCGKACYLAMPPIMRKRSEPYLQKLQELLQNPAWQGVLVRNLETLGWLEEIGYQGAWIADYSLYAWNQEAQSFLTQYCSRMTIPMELNRKEIKQIQATGEQELVLYGRLPLMYAANCVQNTMNHCEKDLSGKQKVLYLTDRYNNQFPVLQNCLHCFTILYNTVPLSLHTNKKVLLEENFAVYRMEFTLENAEETDRILQYYIGAFAEGKELDFPIKDYTNGHYKRGVE